MAENDNPSPLSTEIGGRLYLAHRYARAATNTALRRHQLDLRHLGVLGLLITDGPVNQRKLGRLLQMDKSSMVYVVDELERQGLATRERDPNDRRSYAISATPTGHTRYAEAMTTAADTMDELLADMPQTERRQLNDLLGRFIDIAAHHDQA